MSPREEAIQLLKAANSIAILLGGESSWDAFGATVALSRTLKQLGKSVSIFTAAPLSSLPTLFPVADLTSDGSPPRDFIISFDLARSPIKELKYEREENRLNIILSPQGGAISREDIEFRLGPLTYDLVLTLGVPEIRAIESTVEETPELLHEKTLVNIDYHPGNTRYGDVNVIEAGAGSLSEIVFALLEELGAAPVAPTTASALLAGMVEAAGLPFTAKGLATIPLVARLLDSGADAAGVSKALGERRGLGAVQLLGRALARTRYEPETGILFAVVSGEDFTKTGRGPEELPNVLSGLENYFPMARSFVLLWQHPADNLVRAVIRSREVMPDRIEERTFASFKEAEEVIRTPLETIRAQSPGDVEPPQTYMT